MFAHEWQKGPLTSFVRARVKINADEWRGNRLKEEQLIEKLLRRDLAGSINTLGVWLSCSSHLTSQKQCVLVQYFPNTSLAGKRT
jgi:hypothetical protein